MCPQGLWCFDSCTPPLRIKRAVVHFRSPPNFTVGWCAMLVAMCVVVRVYFFFASVVLFVVCVCSSVVQWVQWLYRTPSLDCEPKFDDLCRGCLHRRRVLHQPCDFCFSIFFFRCPCVLEVCIVCAYGLAWGRGECLGAFFGK